MTSLVWLLLYYTKHQPVAQMKSLSILIICVRKTVESRWEKNMQIKFDTTLWNSAGLSFLV